MQEFVLASASPRRKALLSQAGYRFETIATDAPEPDPKEFPSVESYVACTAQVKAFASASHRPSDERWIVAADTACAAGNEVLGKPVDRADAERILRMLQGSEHRTLTGVCLYLPRLQISLSAVVTTLVYMRELSNEELERYLDSRLWEGKAGGYGIQLRADPFVTRIEGSFSNVVGLPMERLPELFAHADALEREHGKG